MQRQFHRIDSYAARAVAPDPGHELVERRGGVVVGHQDAEVGLVSQFLRRRGAALLEGSHGELAMQGLVVAGMGDRVLIAVVGRDQVDGLP